MNTREFSIHYNVPIVGSDFKFPNHFAVHVPKNQTILNDKFIFSSHETGKQSLTSSIDEYLGTTDFVFFSLGKGYLKRDCPLGLIYDPIEIIKTPNTNLVMNDLLYVLNKSEIVQQFCLKHLPALLEILRNHDNELLLQIKSDPKLNNKKLEKLDQILIDTIKEKKSLLVYDKNEAKQHTASLIFEYLLKILPDKLKIELASTIQKNITKPNTITDNLEQRIKELCKLDYEFLDSFSDEILEERIIELRVPKKYPITNGLIAIYCG